MPEFTRVGSPVNCFFVLLENVSLFGVRVGVGLLHLGGGRGKLGPGETSRNHPAFAKLKTKISLIAITVVFH